MEEKYVIRKVTEYSPEILSRIQTLAQMEGKNYKELTAEAFQELLSSPSIHLYVAEDNHSREILGMVTILVCRIPYVKKSTMEDLVVDEAYRGRGIGTALIKHAVEEAKRLGASYLDFTSRPRREGENALYQKLGFMKRETNVYRQVFDYGEV